MCCRSKTKQGAASAVYRTGSKRVSVRSTNKTTTPTPSADEGYPFEPTPERVPVYKTLRRSSRGSGRSRSR